MRVVITDAAGNRTISPEISFTVGAAPVTGLPDSYTLINGKSVGFTPSPTGGSWTYDSAYLSLSENGGKATFTAKKTGKTYVAYAAGGTEFVVAITINESTIPQTEDVADPVNAWPYALAGLVLLFGAGIWAIFKIKGRHQSLV
ncbi:MAG: hypothetical protein ACOX8I_08740 [Bacillota bacterium]